MIKSGHLSGQEIANILRSGAITSKRSPQGNTRIFFQVDARPTYVAPAFAVAQLKDGTDAYISDGRGEWIAVSELANGGLSTIKAGQLLSAGPDGTPPTGTKVFRFVAPGVNPNAEGAIIPGDYPGQGLASTDGLLGWFWNGFTWTQYTAEPSSAIKAGQLIETGPDGSPPEDCRAFRFCDEGTNPNAEGSGWIGQFPGQQLATRDGISGWWWNGFTWTAYSPDPVSSIKAGQLIETGPDGAPPEDCRAFRFIDIGTNPTTLAEVGSYKGQIIATRDGVDSWEWNGSAWVTWSRYQGQRTLIKHINFLAEATQDIKVLATPTIGGVKWRTLNMGNVTAAAVINGTGLVMVPQAGTSTYCEATNQITTAPALHTLLSPGDSNSLGALFPGSNPSNPANKAVHFLAVYDVIADLGNAAPRGGYFGFMGNEALNTLVMTDASDANCFMTRLGLFGGPAQGPIGWQSGVAQTFKNGTNYTIGRGASGSPISTNSTLEQLVQLISVDQYSIKIQSAPIAAAPGPSGFPNWSLFTDLSTYPVLGGVGNNRAWLKHLFFALGQAAYSGIAPGFIVKHLYIYADIA